MTKRRDKHAALKFRRKLIKRYGHAEEIVTDRFASYRATLRDLGGDDRQITGCWLYNRVENAPCSASVACEVCRNSPPFSLLTSTISTRIVASPKVSTSTQTVPLLLPSGAIFSRHKGQHHCPGGDWIAFV